jgi:hypothetical protein
MRCFSVAALVTCLAGQVSQPLAYTCHDRGEQAG